MTSPDMVFYLSRLRPPPWQGLRGFLVRCAYKVWDEEHPTGWKIWQPSSLELLLGRAVLGCLRLRHPLP